MPTSPLLWVINVPSALMLAVGYLMVRYNAATLSFLFPDIGASARVESLEPSVVAVGCLGLWILAGALPSLVRALLLYAPDTLPSSSMTRATGQRSAAGYFVQAVLGLFIALRPRQVLALWRV